MILFTFFAGISFAQSPLDAHRWQHRVLLIFAPDQQHSALQEQLILLTQKSTEVTDRDLIFYTINTSGGSNSMGALLQKSEAIAIRRQFAVSEQQFLVILVGKDGTEKLRRWEATDPRVFFALIDTMPMRQSELKQRRKGR